MGTFLKGINGAFSGKVGSVVGAKWRQVNYMRSLPSPSSKPASERQLGQRAKFALAVSFLSPIKDFLNVGFSDAQQAKSTGYNIALRQMLSTAMMGDYPDVGIDFERVQLSRGPIAPLFGVTIDVDTPGQAVLSWSSVLNKYNSFVDDEVIIMTFNKNKSFFNIYQEVTRGDGTMSIPLPEVFAGDELVVWTIMANRDGVRTSNTAYAGTITIA